MPRTPASKALDDISTLYHEAERTGIPADELDDMWAERSAARDPAAPPVTRHEMARREFLRRAGGVLAGAMSFTAFSFFERRRALAAPPRIAIVGAGLSGMTSAYRLWQAGYSSTVYEASDHLLGRSWTLRGFFDNGQYVEHGGEFINSDQEQMLELVNELSLPLDDLWVPWPTHTQAIYYFNGHRYPRHQAFLDFREVFPALKRDLRAAPWPPLWNRSHSPEELRLDRMSLTEWIERNVPGGMASDFGKFTAIAYIGEYALDPDQQSALNLMYEMGYSSPHHFHIYGLQDWRYQVQGGNDQVVSTIESKLPPGTAQVNSPLVAIRSNLDGTVTLTIDGSGGPTDVVADRVILALPFSTLKDVDFSQAGFDALKTKCINRFGMGTNAKLHMQFDRRVWYGHGWNGVSLADTGFQNTWEVDMGDLTGPGTLVDYAGGSLGTSYGSAPAHGVADPALVKKVLKQMAPLEPGLAQHYNGKAYLDYWAADPWHKGSYACYMPGQWTEFLGSQRVPQGNIFFAGEHTSVSDQGYMDGAVESGNRAAAQLIASVT